MQNLVQITRLARSDYYDSIYEIKQRMIENLIPPQLPPEYFSKKISESFLAPPGEPIPDCLTCGVCCAYALCVSVKIDDPTLPENYWEITMDGDEEIVVNRYLRRTAQSCDWLGGELGKQVACRIYETRPIACRAFEAGSDRCHAYRRMFGYEPPLTAEEIAKAEALLNSNALVNKITHAMITKKGVGFEVAFGSDGSMSQNTFTLLQITAYLGDDETPHEIHEYNPAEENWLEGDFLGYTLVEAEELIASRHKK